MHKTFDVKLFDDIILPVTSNPSCRLVVCGSDEVDSVLLRNVKRFLLNGTTTDVRRIAVFGFTNVRSCREKIQSIVHAVALDRNLELIRLLTKRATACEWSNDQGQITQVELYSMSPSDIRGFDAADVVIYGYG
jgi:hypothetical protein